MGSSACDQRDYYTNTHKLQLFPFRTLHCVCGHYKRGQHAEALVPLWLDSHEPDMKRLTQACPGHCQHYPQSGVS